MRLRTALIAAILVATVGAGGARAAGSNDSSFVSTAQEDVLGQYALAALARSKASDASAKALANMVAANADKANTWLKKYAAEHNVSLPNRPNVRTSVQYGTLQGSSGASFDKTFAQDVNIDSQMQLGDFQDAASGASDPALKTFAKTQVVELQRFSSEAQKVSH
jgi:predicted outer membrane protein